MDELTLLRQFRAAVPGPSESARERALRFDRRGRKRLVVAGAVAFAVAAFVTSAFAFGLVPGSPAPKSVRDELARMMKPPRKELLELQSPRGPRLLIEQTRLLALSRPYVVWVVPRADGKRCVFAQRTGARLVNGLGCSERQQKLSWGLLETMIGGFTPRRTATIEVLGPPAKTVKVKRGFYFTPVPGIGAPRQVIARDAGGRVLARAFPLRTVTAPTPPPQVVLTTRTAVQITTRAGGKASLVLGPGEGGACITMAGPGWRSAEGEMDCGSPFPARGIVAWPRVVRGRGAKTAFIQGRTGWAGPHIRMIRLRFEDGMTVPVEFGLRLFLYEVQPRNYKKRHRPDRVIGLDGNGRVVARWRIGPYRR